MMPDDNYGNPDNITTETLGLKNNSARIKYATFPRQPPRSNLDHDQPRNQGTPDKFPQALTHLSTLPDWNTLASFAGQLSPRR